MQLNSVSALIWKSWTKTLHSEKGKNGNKQRDICKYI